MGIDVMIATHLFIGSYRNQSRADLHLRSRRPKYPNAALQQVPISLNSERRTPLYLGAPIESIHLSTTYSKCG